MKLTSITALYALNLLPAAIANSCGADKPWGLSILDGAGLKYFATGSAGRQEATLDNDTTLCLPPGSVTVSVGAASGAMGALNTLVECNFGPGLSFCDISMIQGYSVSLTCEVAGGNHMWLNAGNNGAAGAKTLGYGDNLFSHNTCAHFDAATQVCINDNGPATMSSASDLADSTFFHPAEVGGSETFVSSKNAYPFKSDSPQLVECRVASAGKSAIKQKKKAGKKSARSPDESADVIVDARSEDHSAAHQHQHQHQHQNKRAATHLRPHARSLLDVVDK